MSGPAITSSVTLPYDTLNIDPGATSTGPMTLADSTRIPPVHEACDAISAVETPQQSMAERFESNRTIMGRLTPCTVSTAILESTAMTPLGPPPALRVSVEPVMLLPSSMIWPPSNIITGSESLEPETFTIEPGAACSVVSASIDDAMWIWPSTAIDVDFSLEACRVYSGPDIVMDVLARVSVALTMELESISRSASEPLTSSSGPAASISRVEALYTLMYAVLVSASIRPLKFERLMREGCESEAILPLTTSGAAFRDSILHKLLTFTL